MEIEYSPSKAIWHTDKIRALQQGMQIAPTEIQIDPMAYCNDNCSFCSYRKEDGYNNTMLNLIDGLPSTDNKPIGKPLPDSMMPADLAVKIPEQMVEAGIPAIEVTGGGEPTLWPAFNVLFENLYKHKREIGLVTNGSVMTEDRVKLIGKATTWVRFSMDSATPETHKILHRTSNMDFERRLGSLKNLAETKNKDLVLGISFIITPDNVHEMHQACELYSRLFGVNNLRFSWMYDKEGHAGLSAQMIKDVKKRLDVLVEMYSREDFRVFYEKDRIDQYTKQNTDFKTCYFQRFVWAIGADCKVYPCCIMKYHPDYAYADIREKSLAQIVNDMNTIHMMDTLKPMACFPCWLRNRNIQISKAVEKPMHANFI